MPYQPYRTVFRPRNPKLLAISGVSVYPLSIRNNNQMSTTQPYIALMSNTSQTVLPAVANDSPATPLVLSFDTLIDSSSITWSAGFNTKININQTGVYEIVGNFMLTNNFSPGFSAESLVFITKNAVNVPLSTNQFSSVGTGTAYMFTGSWVLSLDDGDYISFNLTFPKSRNITSVVCAQRIPTANVAPNIPGIIITMQKIS